MALSVIQVFIPKRLPVRKRDALRCPDFPLPLLKAAIEQLAFCAKIVILSLINSPKVSKVRSKGIALNKVRSPHR